ncbi:Holliday junction resolvase RuvX [Phormidium tenue FACHB-886]|nr:Holliday junction resolvase RuvX [Phormidium tenue FACHB-886]
MTQSGDRISALGLDVGKKRIGVAGCDGTGLIATGLTTIERRSFAEDAAQLQALATERQARLLVVGLPYNMSGTLGFQAQQVQRFANRLAAVLELPVEYVDERLTSIEAEGLIQADRRASVRQKGLVDRKAAAIILQRWLDERRAKRQQPEAEP